jgi:hypothetical protein
LIKKKKIRPKTAHVTDTPDDNEIMMFKSGTWKGLNAEMFSGDRKYTIFI